MKKVKRSKIKKPECLTGVDSPGIKEKNKAIEFYSDPENQEKPFKFKEYKNPEVKKALNDLFSKKCAYCESYYGGTQPVDIEHFRPKGAVVVGDDDNKVLIKPGYYWLAAEWRNLLPSCIDCNRARTQEFPDSDPELSGKANLFPVGNEGKRWRNHTDKDEEKRLLLDPCRDFPKKHLEFIDQGVARASNKANGPSKKGEESIRVYGLNRSGLVRARRDRQMQIKSQMDSVKRIIKLVNENTGVPGLNELLTKQLEDLHKFKEDSQPYSGMASQMIEVFIETI